MFQHYPTKHADDGSLESALQSFCFDNDLTLLFYFTFRYKAACFACSLEQDLQILPNGDETEVKVLHIYQKKCSRLLVFIILQAML